MSKNFQVSLEQLIALFLIGASISLGLPLALELDSSQIILAVITAAGLGSASFALSFSLENPS